MNIYDIAKKAGVSIATVSRVLNKSTKVKSSTRAKILAVIEENNYVKKSELNKSKIIAIVFSTLKNNSIAFSVDCLITGLAKSGYKSMLFSSPSDNAGKKVLIDSIMDMDMAGIIIDAYDFLTYSNEDNNYIMQNIKIPAVIINGYVENPPINYVINDLNQTVSALASSYIKSGRNKIAFMFSQMSPVTKSIFEGIKDAYFLYNLDVSSDYRQQCRDYFQAEKYLNTLIEKNIFPDLIFSGDDLLAANVVNILKKKNIIIPDDTEIVSFGNTNYCNAASPSITSFDLKIQDVAGLAVDILLGEIKHNEVPVINIISPELIKRETTIL